MESTVFLDRGICKSKAGKCSKLNVTDWLSDVPNIANPGQIIEVRFKNTRRDYFRNVNDLKLEPGDLVAVEANPGHDIGVVSLTGDLVFQQMKKHKASFVNGDFKKVYRKANAYIPQFPSFDGDHANLKIIEYHGQILERSAEVFGTYRGRVGGNGFWDMKPVK